jgi:hypothetical protein
MTEELFAAYRAGQVRAVSVRASDLLGPHVTESLVGERFFGPLLSGKKVQVFADPDVPHSVSFVGDVGRAMVMVGARDEALGRAWHVPNATAVTLRAFAELVREETGIIPRMSHVPRAATRVLLPVLGLAIAPMRGLVENLYVFYEPYVVDHSAFAAAFGEDATPLREAIRQTVAWARSQKGSNNRGRTSGTRDDGFVARSSRWESARKAQHYDEQQDNSQLTQRWAVVLAGLGCGVPGLPDWWGGGHAAGGSCRIGRRRVDRWRHRGGRDWGRANGSCCGGVCRCRRFGCPPPLAPWPSGWCSVRCSLGTTRLCSRYSCADWSSVQPLEQRKARYCGASFRHRRCGRRL